VGGGFGALQLRLEGRGELILVRSLRGEVDDLVGLFVGDLTDVNVLLTLLLEDGSLERREGG